MFHFSQKNIVPNEGRVSVLLFEFELPKPSLVKILFSALAHKKYNNIRSCNKITLMKMLHKNIGIRICIRVFNT